MKCQQKVCLDHVTVKAQCSTGVTGVVSSLWQLSDGVVCGITVV